MTAGVGGARRIVPGPAGDQPDTARAPASGPAPVGPLRRRATNRTLVALVAVSVVVLALMVPAAAVVVAGALLAVRPVQRRALRAARTRALADALPRSLDLCTVVLGAGGTIADAVAALAIAGPEPVRAAGARGRGRGARARVRAAGGEHLDQALRWLQAELGPPLQPLTGALLLAQEQGGPVGLTLARLASEASAGRRRLGETRARRLPVQLIVPLIACSLPAVVAGAVVPLAVVALRQIQL